MNAETLAALKGSIEKWRLIENQGAQDRRSSNCPLCKLFGGTCENAHGMCPVMVFKRVSDCLRTPYMRWASHIRHHESEYRGVHCAECVQIARKEREFLESLLPKEAQ